MFNPCNTVNRNLRRTIVGVLLLIAVLLVQFERASRRREAKLRPLPFRVATTPPPSDAEKAPFYAIVDLGVIPGHNHSFPTSINDAGQIVGVGQHRGKGRAFRLTPLPSGGARSRRPVR